MTLELEGILVFAGINIIMALSVYVMMSAGQLSLGNAAFMALGAYGSSIATLKLGLPFYVGMVLAIPIGVIAGAMVGYPALRTRGIYLIMVTIGVAQVVQVFFTNFGYTGATLGLGGMSGTSLWLVYLVVALLLLFAWKLDHSRLGLAFKAIRDDELAGDCSGLNPTRVKMLSFIIGSTMASLAGVLYAHFTLFINAGHFGLWQSILPALFVILGGSQTFWGAVLGALAWTVLPEYIRPLQEWRIVVFGLAIMLMMALRPQGLISRSLIDSLEARVRSLLPARREMIPIAQAAKAGAKGGLVAPGTELQVPEESGGASSC